MFLSKGLGFGFQGFVPLVLRKYAGKVLSLKRRAGRPQIEESNPKMRNHLLMDSVLLTDPKAAREKDKTDRRMFSRQSVERDLKE